MKRVIEDREELHIKNPELDKKLREDLRKYDIVYMQAPAGWGKYTFLQEFSRQVEEKVFWMNSVSDLEVLLAKWPEEACFIILPRLEQILRECRQGMLQKLVLNKRRNQRLLFASAVSLPEELLVFAAARRLIVYGIQELRPSNDDVKIYFQQKGISLDKDTLLRIEKDFQNMPLYLYLLENPLRQFSGKYISAVREQCREDMFSYLDVTFFRTFKLAEQDVLLHLFCFEVLTAELLCFLFQCTEKNAEDFIRMLLEKGSVLEPYGQGAYRFCPLFRDFLSRAVNKYMDMEELMDLYRLAMDYYQEREDYYSALKFAGLLHEGEKIAEFLNAYLKNPMNYETFLALEDYYIEMPYEYLQRYPRLLAMKAMLEAVIGNRKEAEECTKLLRGLWADTKDSGKRKEINDSLLYLEMTLPGATGPETLSRLYTFLGECEDGKVPDWCAKFRSNQVSILHGDRDHSRYILAWTGQEDSFEVAKERITKVFGDSYLGVLYFLYAEIRYERNQMDEAIAMLSKSLNEARKCKNQRLIAMCNIKLGDILIVQNQTDIANDFSKWALGEEMEKSRLFRSNILAHEMDYELWENNQEQIERWLKEEAPDENERFFATQYYQYLMKAKVYIWKEDYILARMILLSLSEFAENYGMYYLEIQIRLWEAVTYYREKNEKWKASLSEAVERSRKLRFIRVIADEGAAVYEMLQVYAGCTEGLSEDPYFKEVLRVARIQMLLNPNFMKLQKQTSINEFSSYEQDIMRLLAQGEKNAEIAKKLCVSENTVKYHLKNIYQKLDVKSRSQAVNHIKEYHLT